MKNLRVPQLVLPVVIAGLLPLAGPAARGADSFDNTTAEDNTNTTEIRHLHVDQAHPAAAQPRTAPPAQQPGTASSGDSFDRTTITEKQVAPSAFLDEAVGIVPQFGVIALDDQSGAGTARAAAGLTIDVNFLRRVRTESGKPFVGMTFGALYSHLGNPGGDFLGLNGFGGNAGTNLLLLPVDVKAGYTFSDVFRPSLHAGINVVYNNTTLNGPGGLSASDSSWSAQPNLGFDLEFGVGRSVAFLLRPDWTFASNTTIFTGTLGLTFPIT